MKTTTINLTFTKVTFYNNEDEEVQTLNVEGKVTTKEVKEMIPTNAVFIKKEVIQDSFEVVTDELLKLKIKQN